MATDRQARNNIGKALQRLRKDNDLTLAAVSAKTGVAISTLSKIENNQSSPNFDVLTRLAEGLGMDLITLLGRQFLHVCAWCPDRQPGEQGCSLPYAARRVRGPEQRTRDEGSSAGGGPRARGEARARSHEQPCGRGIHWLN